MRKQFDQVGQFNRDIRTLTWTWRDLGSFISKFFSSIGSLHFHYQKRKRIAASQSYYGNIHSRKMVGCNSFPFQILNMGRANLRNTMHDCPLSTEYGKGQLKKTPCTIRPLTTAMTDGCTLNPSVQAESTLFGYFAANTKKANFSLFKYIRFVISMFKRVEPPLGEVTVTNQGH